MKKLSLTLFSLSFIFVAFSQNHKSSLTDSQKAELRKQHNSSLNLKSSNGSQKSNINFTSSNEQSEKDVKVTTVSHYYGKEDSMYSQFVYRQP